MSTVKKPLLLFGLPALLLLMIGIGLVLWTSSSGKGSSAVGSSLAGVGSGTINPKSSGCVNLSSNSCQGTGSQNKSGTNAGCVNLSSNKCPGTGSNSGACINLSSNNCPNTSGNKANGGVNGASAGATVGKNTKSSDPLACNGGSGVKVSSGLGSILGGGNCLSGSGKGGVIYNLVKLIVRFVIGLIGLALVLTIVIAGIQYILSDGSPDVAKGAKDRIRNAAGGFLLLISMTAIMTFLFGYNIFS